MMLSHSAWPHRLSPSTTRILGTTMSLAQSEESGIEPGHIATITGSLASIPEPDEFDPIYDTDHTDLGSEPDEFDLKKELLRDMIFLILLGTGHFMYIYHQDQHKCTFTRKCTLLPQWRQFFDQYDPEGFGEIPWPDLLTALEQPEFRQRVGSGKREVLMEKARSATTPAITFQDFVNVVKFGFNTRLWATAPSSPA